MARESVRARHVRLAEQWDLARDTLGEPTLSELATFPLPPAIEDTCRLALHPMAVEVFDGLDPITRWNVGTTIVGALSASPHVLGTVEQGIFGGVLPPLPRPSRQRAWL